MPTASLVDISRSGSDSGTLGRLRFVGDSTGRLAPRRGCDSRGVKPAMGLRGRLGIAMEEEGPSPDVGKPRRIGVMPRRAKRAFTERNGPADEVLSDSL